MTDCLLVTLALWFIVAAIMIIMRLINLIISIFKK